MIFRELNCGKCKTYLIGSEVDMRLRWGSGFNQFHDSPMNGHDWNVVTRRSTASCPGLKSRSLGL